MDRIKAFTGTGMQYNFNTDNHLLLASGTASGKTEAAFLPILTLLTENPCSTIGVLYYVPIWNI